MAGFFSSSSVLRRLAGAALVAPSLLLPARALAQDRTIRTNHFALDLFQGPILAPISVTGVAGSYAAVAEGISGMVTNAAAPAVRDATSFSTFEIDGAASISIPVSLGFQNNDFDNSGSLDFDYSNFLYGGLGGVIQYGRLGAGFTADLQRYTLTDAAQKTTNITVGKYHLLAGLRFFGDQLTVGAGARFVTLGIAADKNLSMFGAAPEIGVLIRPDWESFRFGATFRAPVDGGALAGESSTIDSHGVKISGGLALPDHVVLPWELEAGVAVQVGPRPLNPAWIDPEAEEQALLSVFRARRRDRNAQREAELAQIADPLARAEREKARLREDALAFLRDFQEERRAGSRLARDRKARYWNWPREHVLLTASILVTGAVDRGVSVQGFLGQTQPGEKHAGGVVGSSGPAVNFSPRFGIEAEPIPDWVHTRLGTYYEPSRFDEKLANKSVGRQHFTFGADLKMIKTTWWGLVPEVIYKVQTSADLAPRYQSFSLGIGVWH
jgi:hypothetical protein